MAVTEIKPSKIHSISFASCFWGGEARQMEKQSVPWEKGCSFCTPYKLLARVVTRAP